MKHIMKPPIEARCIACPLTFCCASCRWTHEQKTHGLTYNCCLCRGLRYLCKPEDLVNQDFIVHLMDEHLPLQCRKCNHVFTSMDDFTNIDKCNSLSELVEKPQVKDPKEIDARFDSLYENVIVNNDDYNEGDSIEAIISINQSNRTAVITPIIRKNRLVDYDESSEESKHESPNIQVLHTPHPKLVPKTPKLQRQRAATPHAKKFISLMRQKVVEEFEREEEKEKLVGDSPDGSKTTPNRKDDIQVPESQSEITTPTSQMNERCLMLAQIVTTSTPTNPAVGAWSMFPEQGADSPLSEIEGTTADSIDHEPSKADSTAPKLKSIIVTGSRLKLGSQDSSEKQVTFQDSPVGSVTDGSEVKAKKVKFAEDTVFEQEAKVKRVFRKPKRMLTPGPRKPNRFCFNPRFQALINRFEHQGITVARTPVTSIRDREIPQESTPPVGEHANMPARAINFKEDSPVVNAHTEKDSNELFKSCIDSPSVSSEVALNTAITTLTTNIAGSLQNCLSSALKENEEETEIQFKFVITKRKVTRLKDNGNEMKGIEEGSEEAKENIWSTVARVVKNVIWGDQGMNLASLTPVSSCAHDSTTSSGSKRKSDDLSDSELSPLNHKRHKYSGRLRGRPPLPRAAWSVAALRGSHSAEQHSLVKELSKQDDVMNLSF